MGMKWAIYNPLRNLWWDAELGWVHGSGTTLFTLEQRLDYDDMPEEGVWRGFAVKRGKVCEVYMDVPRTCEAM